MPIKTIVRMESSVRSPNENIRKIEDIIDIQKANGNYGVRQVAFTLPTSSGASGAAGCACSCAAGLARSLDSGLSESKSDPRAGAGAAKKKPKRAKRHASPLPDAVSWPSDSDITVLRMKLCQQGAGAGELKEAVGDAVPGDGLHRPDSSSMVNLATLMLQSQPPSKHGLGAEEYLLPLTSWERDKPPPPPQPPPEGRPRPVLCGLRVHDATCDNLSSKDSGIFSRLSMKSKVAKFLRLYFCPCCTCLYEMEKMRDEPSVYLTKCNTAETVQI